MEVPNNHTATMTLWVFIYRDFFAYTRITNWQILLEYLPILPLEDYETFIW
jgi:hypothetical protein